MRLPFKPAIMAAAFVSFSLPALAHEHVYADAFGNLVIESAAGYKRILVGKGDLAGDMAKALDANQPEIVLLGGGAASVTHHGACKPLIHHGRSAMWGLDRGETPNLDAACQ